MKISDIVKNQRNNSMLSQAELSSLSGASIPTIQNIESGKANPSFNTLRPILECLNLRIEFQSFEPDWEFLISCGLPLTSVLERNFIPDVAKLKLQLVRACLYIRDHSRYRIALESFLFAIATRYPSNYRKYFKTRLIDSLVPTQLTGKHLKLIRISEERLADYL